MTTAEWSRLGAVIRAERSRHRGWRRREEFARACGLSVRTIEALENGERHNFSVETVGAIEMALGWEPGSAQRVLHGLPPVRQVDEHMARLQSFWDQLPTEARRLVVDFAERALGHG